MNLVPDLAASGARFRSLVAAAMLAHPAIAAAQEAPLTNVQRAHALADSLAAKGDTVHALAILDTLVRHEPRSAEAWYYLGMLSARSVQGRRNSGFMSSLDVINRLRIADTSLRIAARLAPDSARYWLGLGKFFLASDVATMRLAAQGFFDKALDAARRVGEPVALADAASEVGMVHWRRFETVADRRMTHDNIRLNPDTLFALPPGKMIDLMNDMTQPINPWPGQLDYDKALLLFREAYAALPVSTIAERHLYMAFAERNRWEELKSAARNHLATTPWDPLAWQARGLAEHRTNHPQAASVAFDSALANMTAADRARFTRLSRIMRPRPEAGSGFVTDSASYAKMSSAVRAQLDAVYWMLDDPLALTPENEHRLEFLSRVTFSEIRWTSEEYMLPGANSDRGDIFVRFGPPDYTMTMNFANAVGEAGMVNSAMTIFWMYKDGLAFAFKAPPTFGMASLWPDYATRAEGLRHTLPVRWTNLSRDVALDSIDVQIARFRTSTDSADVYIAAELPIDSLMIGAQSTLNPIDVGLIVYDQAARVAVRDSARVHVALAADQRNDVVRVRAWRPRLAAGVNVVRVEAMRPEGVNAARSLTKLTIAATDSFGLSDILIAERAAPKADVAASGVKRWSDYVILPSAGRFRRGQPVDLLWETYRLGARDGNSRYRVTVSLEQQKGSKSITARVLGGVSGIIGRSVSGKGRVSLAYDQTAPAQPVAVDYLRLDISAVPAGKYRLRIDVEDRVTMKKTSRETTLTVVE